MKAIRWIGATGIVNLQLGDNPVLEITDSYGNEVLFNVTQEDLEGISDILIDGKYELEKVERKKRDELEEQELQKSRERFRLGVIGGVSISEMLKKAASEIKAKLDADSKEPDREKSTESKDDYLKRMDIDSDRKEESNA